MIIIQGVDKKLLRRTGARHICSSDWLWTSTMPRRATSPNHAGPHGRARIQQPAFRASTLRQTPRHPQKRGPGGAAPEADQSPAQFQHAAQGPSPGPPLPEAQSPRTNMSHTLSTHDDGSPRRRCENPVQQPHPAASASSAVACSASSCSGCSGALRGMLTVISVNSPGSDCTRISPPCWRTMSAESERPRPVP